MKLRLLFLPIAAALVSLPQAGCVQSTTYKRNDDGSKSIIESYGLTERAGALLDAGIRNRLRLPQESPKRIEPAK